jgi:hypothetical protein
MTSDPTFAGWEFKCEGSPTWHLMFESRDCDPPTWYVSKQEEGQAPEDVDAQRWFDPDAAMIEAWLLTNGVPEEAVTSIVHDIEENPPPGWLNDR